MRWDLSDIAHTLLIHDARAGNSPYVNSVIFPVSAIENVTLALKCMAN